MNGPLGYVERKPFNKGTEELAKVIADHNCFSIAGGGDTLPIIENLNYKMNINVIYRRRVTSNLFRGRIITNNRQAKLEIMKKGQKFSNIGFPRPHQPQN